MRFTTSKPALLSALNITGKAIGKSIIPIMDCYLFNIDNNKLSITGSSEDVSITKIIDISGNGLIKLIAIPSSRLLGLIKTLPEVPIHFEIQERIEGKNTYYSVTVTAGKGVYVIPAEDGENFPILNNAQQVSFEVKKQDILSGINKTLFCCSTGGEEPFGGVLFSFDGEGITYTGTNRFLLSTFNAPASVGLQKSIVVPGKTLLILQAIADDEIIKVDINDNNIAFKLSENLSIISVLSAMKYPDCKSVIPKNNTSELAVNRIDLINSLKRVSQFSNRVTNSVTLIISQSLFTLKAEDQDFEQVANEDVFHSYKGDDIEISVNGGYLGSSLDKLDCEEVFITLSTPNRPMLLREQSTDPSDIDNLILLMPVIL